jgi:hypothetical protein
VISKALTKTDDGYDAKQVRKTTLVLDPKSRETALFNPQSILLKSVLSIVFDIAPDAREA